MTNHTSHTNRRGVYHINKPRGGKPLQRWRVWVREHGASPGQYAFAIIVEETGVWRAKHLAQIAVDELYGVGLYSAVKVEDKPL